MHLHEIKDSDNHFVINPITMEISNENSEKNELNQGDHNSEIFTFEIPKIVEGHDMSLCNTVRIHYINTGANKADVSKDYFPVTDISLAEDNSDMLVFSWLISGNATMYNGTLNFRILFAGIDENGKYVYKKWTDIYKGITIGEGFDNSKAVEENVSDALAEWVAEITQELAEYKPFGDFVEYYDVLTWDGNTDGLESIVYDDKNYYKVSDNVPTLADLQQGFALHSATKSAVTGTEITADEASGHIKQIADDMLAISMLDWSYTNYASALIIITNSGIYFYANDVSYLCDFAINGYTFTKTTIKKVPAKYLEDHTHSWEQLEDKPFYKGTTTFFSVENAIFDNTIIEGMACYVCAISQIPSVGSTVKVIWDSTEYECVTFESDGAVEFGTDFLVTGEEDGIPFVVSCGVDVDGSFMAVILDVNALLSGLTSSTHTISCHGEFYKTIDYNFLPMKHVDWNADNTAPFGKVINKPFYKTYSHKYEWDGNIEGKEIITLADGTKMCKISDSADYAPNSRVRAYFYMDSHDSTSGEELMVCVGNLGHNQIKKYYTEIVFLYAYYAVSADAYLKNLTGLDRLEEGIYFAYKTDSSGNVTKYVKELVLYETKELNEMYLPRKFYTNEIKLDSIKLHSSTDGSTKYFSITVDDDGNLKATEVTN